MKILVLLSLVGLFSILMYSSNDLVFGAQTISDRIEINDDNVNLDIAAGDLFGYLIEPIGDLDTDGVTDLAVIKFEDDSGETDAGSVLIMFMNLDGSVKGTNEIIMDDSAAGILTCLASGTVNRDRLSLEQLAFVGDLDGDGEPTLALGASSNDHPDLATGADQGAVYMLELNTDGTVDNCVRIIPGENGFNPDDSVYNEVGQGNAALGWPLIATDLDGDGQNELITGADNENDTHTNLWVLFLDSTGAVSSHPAIPIKGETDIGIDFEDWIDDGISIDGGTKIAVSAQAGGVGGVDDFGGGSVFIINLTTAGAFSSSTEITGISIGQGITTGPLGDRFGSGLAPLGDMDGDGVDDILVGNVLGDDIIKNSGEAYILYMNSDDTVKETQKISNQSEFDRTGIAPLGDTDLFGHGMAVWRENGNDAVIAISAHQDDIGGTKAGTIHLFYVERWSGGTSGGVGGCTDCIPPTLGINKRGDNMVTNGFSFNGVYTNVLYFHTPFPLISTQTGVNNTMTFKMYENHGVKDITNALVGLGMENTIISVYKAEVLFDINFIKGAITDITIKDDNSLIQNVTAISEITKCKELSNSEECLEVTLNYFYRESPMYNIVAVAPYDDNGLWWPVYFNDGIKVEGESLNPPQVRIISGIEYTEINKFDRTWIDSNEIIYKMSKSELMERITPWPTYVCNDTPLDEINGGYGKDNCHFRSLTSLWD